jgi:hypothetical protein
MLTSGMCGRLGYPVPDKSARCQSIWPVRMSSPAMHKPAMLPAANKCRRRTRSSATCAPSWNPTGGASNNPACAGPGEAVSTRVRFSRRSRRAFSAAAPPVPWPHFRALRGRHSVVPPRRPAFGRHPPQIPQRYSDMDVRASDHHPEGPGLVSGRFSRQPPGGSVGQGVRSLERGPSAALRVVGAVVHDAL